MPEFLEDDDNIIDAMQKELATLKATHPNEEDLDEFLKIYKIFIKTRSDKINWQKIEPPEGKLFQYDDLKDNADAQNLLSKLAVLKLNGGLGTTMGCDGPKSSIRIKNGMYFLDIVIRQLNHLNTKYDCDVPLVLMNSFNTEAKTRKMTKNYKNIKTFNQSMFPRISVENLLPIETEVFYPPGHGDIYYSMTKSGMLDELLKEGKEYLFVSNIDNLAATVDLKILNFIIEEKIDFCMEVTEKTRADIKGGTLVNYNKKLTLLEIAQVPGNKKTEFTSVRKFKIFNTNSAWIDLQALKKMQDKMELDLIQNKKVVHGETVIQLETALGAAVKYFDNNCGIVVPRSRFLPVKTCSDLFLLESNLYTEKNGFLEINPARISKQQPIVKLIGANFQKIRDFENKFAEIPDIVNLDILTVVGNVTFGEGVVLEGTVIINATVGGEINIADGSVIEDKIICGSLPSISL